VIVWSATINCDIEKCDAVAVVKLRLAQHRSPGYHVEIDEMPEGWEMGDFIALSRCPRHPYSQMEKAGVQPEKARA
jgi:hypothetical protein